MKHLKYFWIIFGFTYSVLAFTHFDAANIKLEHFKNPGVIKAINGMPLGVAENNAALNLYIDKINKSNQEGNNRTAIGYVIAAFTALFSFVMCFVEEKMCINKKFFQDWLKLPHETLNYKRLGWGVAFFIIGVALFIAPKFNPVYSCEMIYRWITYHYVDLLWVAGWSSVGIGIGLINSRTREKKEKEKECRDDQHLHYVMYYWIFALFLVSLAAYALGRSCGGVLDKPLSALIGLTLGFAAERINQLGLIKN